MTTPMDSGPSSPDSGRGSASNSSACWGTPDCKWVRCPVHSLGRLGDALRPTVLRSGNSTSSGPERLSGPEKISGGASSLPTDTHAEGAIRRNEDAEASQALANLTVPAHIGCYHVPSGESPIKITYDDVESGLTGVRDPPPFTRSSTGTPPVEIRPSMNQVLISDYGVIQDPTGDDQPLITPGMPGPYRTYGSWRREITAEATKRMKFRYVLPTSVPVPTTQHLTIRGVRSGIPVKENDEDTEYWLATGIQDDPLHVYWDELIREICNTDLPQEDRDRLYWAWMNFQVRGKPIIDLKGGWRQGQGKCPFFDCVVQKPKYFSTDALFARHLVECHCQRAPRYYCNPARGRAARCNSVIEGEDLPYYTSRRGKFVRHLKDFHNVKTVRAVRISELLFYGVDICGGKDDICTVGHGLMWWDNTAVTRLWLARDNWPNYLVQFPHYAGITDTGSIKRTHLSLGQEEARSDSGDSVKSSKTAKTTNSKGVKKSKQKTMKFKKADGQVITRIEVSSDEENSYPEGIKPLTPKGEPKSRVRPTFLEIPPSNLISFSMGGRSSSCVTTTSPRGNPVDVEKMRETALSKSPEYKSARSSPGTPSQDENYYPAQEQLDVPARDDVINPARKGLVDPARIDQPVTSPVGALNLQNISIKQEESNHSVSVKDEGTSVDIQENSSLDISCSAIMDIGGSEVVSTEVMYEMVSPAPSTTSLTPTRPVVVSSSDTETKEDRGSVPARKEDSDPARKEDPNPARVATPIPTHTYPGNSRPGYQDYCGPRSTADAFLRADDCESGHIVEEPYPSSQTHQATECDYNKHRDGLIPNEAFKGVFPNNLVIPQMDDSSVGRECKKRLTGAFYNGMANSLRVLTSVMTTYSHYMESRMDAEKKVQMDEVTSKHGKEIDYYKRLVTTLQFEKGNDKFALEETLKEEHRKERDATEEVNEAMITKLKRQLESTEAQLDMTRAELIEKDKFNLGVVQQLEDTNFMVNALNVNHEATKLELANLQSLQMANAGWASVQKNYHGRTWEDAQHQDYKDRVEKQHRLFFDHFHQTMDTWYENTCQAMACGSPNRAPIRLMHPNSPMSLGMQGINHLSRQTSVMDTILANNMAGNQVPTDLLSMAAASANIRLDGQPLVNPRVEAIIGAEALPGVRSPTRAARVDTPAGSPLNSKDAQMLLSPSPNT